MDELQIRRLQDTDYDEILTKWWADWKWEPPKRNFLPDNGTGGLIVYDGDEPVCAGFMYVTNSDVYWVDWIISSRTYNKKPQRKNAIKLLIESMTQLCDKVGAKYVYALIKHQSLTGVYEELGYKKGDSYNYEMIKFL